MIAPPAKYVCVRYCRYLVLHIIGLDIAQHQLTDVVRHILLTVQAFNDFRITVCMERQPVILVCYLPGLSDFLNISRLIPPIGRLLPFVRILSAHPQDRSNRNSILNCQRRVRYSCVMNRFDRRFLVIHQFPSSSHGLKASPLLKCLFDIIIYTYMSISVFCFCTKKHARQGQEA